MNSKIQVLYFPKSRFCYSEDTYLSEEGRKITYLLKR